MRIVTLGEFALKHYPEYFPHISDPSIAKKFLALHDQAKVNPIYSDPEGLPNYKLLYLYFGRESDELTKRDLKKRSLIIEKINKTDEQISLRFFEENNLFNTMGLPTEEAKDLLRLEHLVDLVDRGMNRVTPEEFARSMHPASEIFDDSEKEIAEMLEKRYHEIIDIWDWEE